jgi:hypothetical protein
MKRIHNSGGRERNQRLTKAYLNSRLAHFLKAKRKTEKATKNKINQLGG